MRESNENHKLFQKSVANWFLLVGATPEPPILQGVCETKYGILFHVFRQFPALPEGHRLTGNGHRQVILLSFGANNSGPNIILHSSGDGGVPRARLCTKASNHKPVTMELVRRHLWMSSGGFSMSRRDSDSEPPSRPIRPPHRYAHLRGSNVQSTVRPASLTGQRRLTDETAPEV